MLCYILFEVVEFCFRELFELVMEEICCLGLEDQIVVGFVIIGGIVKMIGVMEVVEDIF